MSQRPKTPKNTILPLTIHTKVSETVDQAKTLDVNRAEGKYSSPSILRHFTNHLAYSR